MTFLLLLFPNGRLLSRRWRPVGWLSVLWMVLLGISSVFQPGPLPYLPEVMTPLGIEGAEGVLEVLAVLAMPLVVGTMLASVASVVVRFRRARGVERQQLKWFTYAAAVLVGAWSVSMALVPWDQAPTPAAGALLLVAIPWLPIAVGIAVLRYRLYEIDLLINRTLVYGALTATLALTYWASVVLLQQFLRPLTEGSDLAIIAATLAVAALFQPVRRRIQATVDRRFYRGKYDAQKTLEAFSARLREQTDLHSLSRELVSVVQRTTQPSKASLWLRAEREA